MYKEEFNELEKMNPNNNNNKIEAPTSSTILTQSSLREDSNVTDSETTRFLGNRGGSFYLDDDDVVDDKIISVSASASASASAAAAATASFGVVSGQDLGTTHHVSLALELRHCESDGLSTLASPGGPHLNGNNNINNHDGSSLDYHHQRQRSRFSATANPAHLLHDFVV